MIEIEELERISEIKGLNIRNTEKDYLLELLLFRFCQEIGNDLIFKGGTALYKLHSLNRFSEDLDFTLASPKINLHKILDKVIKKIEDSGISVKIKEFDDYKNQTNVKLEFKGPLFKGNPKNITLIVINVSKRERPLYNPEERRIFPKYPDIPMFSVFTMPLGEVLAEKIRTVFKRDKARDVYDLWFLLKKGTKFLLGDVNKKLKLNKLSFNRNTFVEKLSEKEKYWEDDLKGIIIGPLPEFKLVKKEIIENLK